MLVLCYSELIVSQNSMERREKKIMSVNNAFLACSLQSVIRHLQPHYDSHIYTLACIFFFKAALCVVNLDSFRNNQLAQGSEDVYLKTCLYSIGI